MKFVGIFTLILLVCMPSSFAEVKPNSSNIVYLKQEENQLFIMLNKFRAQLGLPTVEIHVYLQNAAKKHSEWMAANNFLTHYGPTNNKTPFQRMKEEGYVGYTTTGENVACGNGDAVKTFRQWAFSPGHLSNMLNPHFRHIGIFRAGTGDENCPYYWTNDFGSMTDPRLDVVAPTDVQKISAAIENIAGTIPTDQAIALPTQQQNGVSNEATPTVAVKNNNYSLIQCMVPYAVAKNILSFVPQTDALVELTPNDFGSYKGKITFIQDGEAVNYYPLNISNVSVVKNASYPLVMIFAGATSRTGGFMIQFDTAKSSAQFDPYPASSGVSGSVLCSYKL